jgi:hypothetical protein
MGKLVYKLEGLCCKILSQEYGLTDPLSLFDYTGACFFWSVVLKENLNSHFMKWYITRVVYGVFSYEVAKTKWLFE